MESMELYFLLTHKMNWLQKIAQVETSEDYFGGITEIEQWDARYPVAGSTVSGLSVGSEIPNTESISAGMDNWKELPGIRELPLVDFGSGAPREVFYAANDIQSSRRLAEEIRNSGWVAPLIVGIDKGMDGVVRPYIMEGLHRLVALHELGAQTLPALVVMDLS